MKVFLVTLDGVPFCMVIADSKDKAIEISSEQAEYELPFAPDSYSWYAWDINQFFDDIHRPAFYAWISNPEDAYRKFYKKHPDIDKEDM